MCGIIGYVGKKAAAPILIEALRRLQYRGYDSAGLAVLSGPTLAVRKKVGKLDEGQSRLDQGQENIQLRVDSLAPQFEVRELTRRVKRLEDRVGIRYSTQH